ncbi:MAG: SdpI family protein [Clostridiales bacterium]|nr:SdpI family protein [Clostridiales bacterium]
MEIFKCIITLIIPVSYIVLGGCFWKHSPQKINYCAGWRTGRSMKNRETWIFANTLGGKCTMLLGVAELIVTTAVLIFTRKSGERTIAYVVLALVLAQTVCFGFVFSYVEKKIKEKFGI